MTRIFGKNGPMLLDKNIGRDWAKATRKSRRYRGPGRKERERAERRSAKAKGGTATC